MIGETHLARPLEPPGLDEAVATFVAKPSTGTLRNPPVAVQKNPASGGQLFLPATVSKLALVGAANPLHNSDQATILAQPLRFSPSENLRGAKGGTLPDHASSTLSFAEYHSLLGGGLCTAFERMIEMPKKKDLKRLVRSRMKKTGEKYTAARTQLTKKSVKKEPATTELEVLAGMSDKTILARTGKTWTQWVRVLDAVDADTMTHTAIATHLHENHHLDGWWAQGVCVGYERIRGLREIGQRRSGRYDASKSKTLPVSAAVAFDAFVNARTRKKWLPGVALTIRKATAPKSIRIGWPDGKIVAVWIEAKGGKCTVGIQQDNLGTRAEANERKAYWAERLSALQELLRD
jgi:hypothetical protein